MAKKPRKMRFSISRYSPGEKMRIQEYELDVATLKGFMLLNALEAIKDTLDPTLKFRRSCGEGVCGSDGMNINGKNGLACITRLRDLPDHVVIHPLPGFPVISDLVVDMTPFFDQYKKVKPYLQNHNPPPTTERLQTPDERAKLDGLYECILCACCTSSCPSYWWNPDKFVGPAGLLGAYRFIADSRDTETGARLEALKDPYSAFRCRTIMNCADVCPKNLNPAEAIAKIRREMLHQSE
ncbi:MAG: succinate dehydrogenase iron-sulfur subunit [Proteobacteria bacterium]|nr:succinate dehydrogenase iron-sulfur subunit [Pseudomonadota bacterium]